MSKIPKRSVLCLALSIGATSWLVQGLVPESAHASAAGGAGLACEATAEVLYVIDDNANGVRDPSETTACTTAVVDTSNPLEPVVTEGVGGPVCLPAVIAQLRGTVTMIADDNAQDNVVGGSQNTGQVFTLLIEVRHQNKVFRVADSYTASLLGNLNIGNWNNRLASEENIFGVAFKGSLFLTPVMQNGSTVTFGALEDMGARLAQIAEDEGLVPDATAVMPIVASATRDAARKRFAIVDPTACGDAGAGVADGCGELEVEEAGPLASIAVYRLTISFAEKLVGSPPSCS